MGTHTQGLNRLEPSGHRGQHRGPWRPLGGPKGPRGGSQKKLFPRQQHQKKKQEEEGTSSSNEEELSAAESISSEAAAAAAKEEGSCSSSGNSEISSADSAEELRCSSSSEFESEEAGEYEDTEGPPSSGGPLTGKGPFTAEPADGLNAALGTELRQKHPDFLDFVLAAGEGGSGDSGTEEDLSLADSEEEIDQKQQKQKQQQQQHQRKMLTQERFLSICKAIGINPLETKKETAGEQQQQPLRSLRGARLLLEALHSALLQLAPKQQQAAAAGAAAAAAAASAGERSKFKQAKQMREDEKGQQQQQQQQQQNSKVLLKRQQQQRGSGTFELPDGETCAFVILAVIRNADCLFTVLSSRSTEPAASPAAAAAAATLPEASSGRLQRLLKSFWGDITYLLLVSRQQNLSAAAAAAGDTKEFVLQVLLALSSKQLLRWGLLQESTARRLLQAVSRYWAFAQHQQQQLAGFAVLRAALQQQAAAATAAAGSRKKLKSSKEGGAANEQITAEIKEQQLLQQLLRSFQKAAARLGLRRTWRAASRMQLLINEMRELLSLAAPSTAYRIAYQSIRELALTVRSALATGSSGAAGSSSSSKGRQDVSKSKAAYRRRHRLQQAQKLLFCWPFVSSCSLWAFSLDLHGGYLKPLLFPLVSVAAAAVKLQQQQLAFAPFCLHLLECIARAGLATDALVPVAAPLLAVLQLLLQQHAAVCRRNSGVAAAHAAAAPQQKKRKRAAAAAGPLRLQQAAPVHAETCLKIDAAQQESLHVLELLIDFGSCLLSRHLAQLAAHPALPEVLLPVLSSLKQITKKAGQFGAVKKLQQLASAAAASAETVKQLRMSLKEIPVGRVAVLPIAKEKQRLPLLALSETLVRERQEAMARGIREEAAAADHRKKKEAEELLTAKQIKRRRQKEQKRAAKQEEQEQQQKQQQTVEKKQKKLHKKETAAPTVPTEDALEEFDSDLSDF